VFKKIAESNEPAKSLDRRGVRRLQADVPVENSSQGSGVSSQESGVSANEIATLPLRYAQGFGSPQ